MGGSQRPPRVWPFLKCIFIVEFCVAGLREITAPLEGVKGEVLRAVGAWEKEEVRSPRGCEAFFCPACTRTGEVPRRRCPAHQVVMAWFGEQFWGRKGCGAEGGARRRGLLRTSGGCPPRAVAAAPPQAQFAPLNRAGGGPRGAMRPER